MKKINLGCGGNILEGFENFDAELDITKPLPFENASVDLILAEHVFEHVDTHAALRFLRECHRVLKHGGVLRLCVPVLDRLSRQHASDIILGHGHKAAYSTNSLKDFLYVAGFEHSSIRETRRHDIDGHWKAIGREQDDTETARLEAIK